MALGLCAVALGWQNARLRGQLGDRSEPTAAVTEARLVATVGSPDEGGGRRVTWSAGSVGEKDDFEGEESGAEVPPPGRQHWAVEFLRPRRGEDLAAYRDRVLPIAQAVVAPQRLRVSERRRTMAAAARLDSGQAEALDAAVAEASDEIVNRVWQALATDEIWPRPRPSVAVALAGELLHSMTSGEDRFRRALRDDQRAAVDRSGFDFVDYLVFSVPWEERFGIAPASGASP
jgi:hypothetical protein